MNNTQDITAWEREDGKGYEEMNYYGIKIPIQRRF